MACTGWTWEQVDELTIPRLDALTNYWERHPPQHILLAAWLGYKAPSKYALGGQSSSGDMAAFMAMGRPE